MIVVVGSPGTWVQRAEPTTISDLGAGGRVIWLVYKRGRRTKVDMPKRTLVTQMTLLPVDRYARACA